MPLTETISSPTSHMLPASPMAHIAPSLPMQTPLGQLADETPDVMTLHTQDAFRMFTGRAPTRSSRRPPFRAADGLLPYSSRSGTCRPMTTRMPTGS